LKTPCRGKTHRVMTPVDRKGARVRILLLLCFLAVLAPLRSSSPAVDSRANGAGDLFGEGLASFETAS
jgi:hypothetical protein